VIITLPMMMAGLSIGSSFASKLVDDPKLKKNLAALSMGIGAGTQLAGAFAPASTGMKIGEGVGPFANPDEYIGGLTGSIADKTQQNFSGWGMNEVFQGDTFKSNTASLYDFNSGLFG